MRLFIFIAALFFSQAIFGQDEKKEPKFEFGGYLHNLQTITYIPDLPPFLNPLPEPVFFSSLIHNRMNLRWYPTSKLSFGWEQRNRFFMGNDVQANPLFATQLGLDPAAADLSWVIWSGNSAALHTRVERLWAEWQANSWEARLGRQRINWGIHLFWNPHDIFNTYSFLEIDNPERSGTDAVRTTFYTVKGTTIDLAYAPGSGNEITRSTHTSAARVVLNKWSYDFQLIGGWRFEEAMGGLGWAGNLGKAGFKGEFAWFQPVLDTAPDSMAAYVLSISIDHTFDKPVFITGGYLFSSRGSNEMLTLLDADLLGATASDISPSNLLPSKHTLLGQVSWSVSPLLGIDIATIYGPGPDLLIFFPSIRYSISNDWDLFAAAQLLFLGDAEGLAHTGDVGFLRVRWNY